MRDMFLRTGSADVHVVDTSATTTSTSETSHSNIQMCQVELALLAWREAWYDQFQWIEFKSEVERGVHEVT
jgi:hypothetical protein